MKKIRSYLFLPLGLLLALLVPRLLLAEGSDSTGSDSGASESGDSGASESSGNDSDLSELSESAVNSGSGGSDSVGSPRRRKPGSAGTQETLSAEDFRDIPPR